MSPCTSMPQSAVPLRLTPRTCGLRTTAAWSCRPSVPHQTCHALDRRWRLKLMPMGELDAWASCSLCVFLTVSFCSGVCPASVWQILMDSAKFMMQDIPPWDWLGNR